MLVESDRNLILGKMFRIQLSLKKVFGDLRFNLVCYMYIFLILYWAFFIEENKIKYLFVSFKK